MVAAVCQEFDESGDPEKHFQELLFLAKKGAEKGKVCITNFGPFSQKDKATCCCFKIHGYG